MALVHVDCAVKCSGGRGGVGIGVGIGVGMGWGWGCGWRVAFVCLGRGGVGGVSTCIGYSDVHNVYSCFPMERQVGGGGGGGWGRTLYFIQGVSTCIGYSDVHNVYSCFPMAY